MRVPVINTDAGLLETVRGCFAQANAATQASRKREQAPLTPVPVGLVTRILPVVASGGTMATMRLSAVALKSANEFSNRTSVAVESPAPLIAT